MKCDTWITITVWVVVDYKGCPGYAFKSVTGANNIILIAEDSHTGVGQFTPVLYLKYYINLSTYIISYKVPVIHIRYNR